MRACKFAVALLLVLPVVSSAQGHGGGRANTWDYSLGAVYQSGETLKGKGGSALDVDSEVGFAFGLGYNLTDRLALGADFNYLRPDYTAIIVDADDPTVKQRVDHTLTQFDFRFKGTYNFLDGPFTPFVEAGLGWTQLDSNVAKGPPVTGCWWHPYWGYVCSNYYRTFSGTDFSYGGSLGVRYAFRNGSFVRVDYSLYKLDIGGQSEDPQLDAVRLQYGWNF
jgi:opacity protein-like surface antigen